LAGIRAVACNKKSAKLQASAPNINGITVKLLFLKTENSRICHQQHFINLSARSSVVGRRLIHIYFKDVYRAAQLACFLWRAREEARVLTKENCF
jgi:hypothetical protein